MGSLLDNGHMKASVLASFGTFQGQIEGSKLPYMYTDNKGLVTTGTGNLIDPLPMALVLPWRRADGTLAARDEIEEAWNTVKNAFPDIQSTRCAGLTTIRLNEPDLDHLLAEKAHGNDEYIRAQFPAFDSWPADAQMAIHSMAWAQGASFQGWPRLSAALNASPPDFLAAAGPPGDAANRPSFRGQAWLNDTGNAGLRPRNLENKVLFQNAARVLANRLDPEPLYWPTELPETGGPGGGWAKGLGEFALVMLILGGVSWGLLTMTPQGIKWAKSQPWIPKGMVRA